LLRQCEDISAPYQSKSNTSSRSKSLCSSLEFWHPAIFASKWDSVDRSNPIQATVVVVADMLVEVASMLAVVVSRAVVADTEATERLAALVKACMGFMAVVIEKSFTVEATTRFLVVELFCLFLLQVSSLPSSPLELNFGCHLKQDSAPLAFLLLLRTGFLWVELPPT
jgi:hypothetical protein